MKVVVKPANGEALDFDVDPGDPLATLKCLVESVRPDVGALESVRFSLKGVILDDDTLLRDSKYQEGDVLLLGAPEVPEPAAPAVAVVKVPVGERPGAVPTAGFLALEITVGNCKNAKTNGLYLPAPPHAGKAAWYKAPSTGEEAPAEDGSTSKDRGERVIYFSKAQERWYVGDDLDQGGFSYASSPGICTIPPTKGWLNGTFEFSGSAAAIDEGDLDALQALNALAKLSLVEPWADQETCYVTMLKVLNNIAVNPGEAKFCSLKIENAAIQNKILRFDGARPLLEAIGFREKDGALALPVERPAQARLAHELLTGYATEAQYQQVRKERHAKAAEEMKKEAARRPAYGGRKAGDDDGGGGGPRFGRDRGPMGGGGGGG